MDIKVEQQELNPDELPFAYFNPRNTLVYWMCSYDEENNLVSIFYGRNKRTDPLETRIAVLNDMKDAITQRDLLINDGWKILPPPKVTFSLPGDVKPKTTKERLRKKLKDKTLNDLKLPNP